MNKIVNDFLSEFSVHSKENGEVYAVNREGALYEFIRDEIHDGHLPDDFRFKTVYRALEDISLQDETALNVPQIEPDIYYSDLNRWASRSISHDYLNQAIESQQYYGIANSYFDLVTRAQQIELDEITIKVYQFVLDELQKSQAQQAVEDDSENEWEA
ncbi:MAG: hypothetical protein E6Q75_15025 [Rheinheimera sp.]|nr:MAG: hypothetical protein E6Q75_15025 [Rheinheimera sp.]